MAVNGKEQLLYGEDRESVKTGGEDLLTGVNVKLKEKLLEFVVCSRDNVEKAESELKRLALKAQTEKETNLLLLRQLDNIKTKILEMRKNNKENKAEDNAKATNYRSHSLLLKVFKLFKDSIRRLKKIKNAEAKTSNRLTATAFQVLKNNYLVNRLMQRKIDHKNKGILRKALAILKLYGNMQSKGRKFRLSRLGSKTILGLRLTRYNQLKALRKNIAASGFNENSLFRKVVEGLKIEVGIRLKNVQKVLFPLNR
eukprot:TRINITY_DN13937_c0_g1_i1.p1 TRINITY_DN13937_c0_g1~~TRINITY_DN13937_c0_g1_i1.p1  ORF type:complete len:269 (-),score=46.44 TRINITY_DN13937_c0_g1_i1:154-918(-)